MFILSPDPVTKISFLVLGVLYGSFKLYTKYQKCKAMDFATDGAPFKSAQTNDGLARLDEALNSRSFIVMEMGFTAAGILLNAATLGSACALNHIHRKNRRACVEHALIRPFLCVHAVAGAALHGIELGGSGIMIMLKCEHRPHACMPLCGCPRAGCPRAARQV